MKLAPTTELFKEELRNTIEPSPIFLDRKEAGCRLAALLAHEAFSDPVVVSIPMGGVPVALPVAERLRAPLYVPSAAKILLHEEDARFGIGALTSDQVVLNEDLTNLFGLDDAYVQARLDGARRVLREKSRCLGRHASAIPKLQDRTAIVVDDGVATGSTALAVVASLIGAQVARILVAVPVAHADSGELLRSMNVGTVIIHESAANGFIVDNFYREFSKVNPRNLRAALDAWMDELQQPLT